MADRNELAALYSLVKDAIGLAIVRHDLVMVEDGEEAVEPDLDEIAKDAWNALQGIDTCDGAVIDSLDVILSLLRV